ncbi:hypothetical protein LCGC14_1994160, partial [marine sediment metagenome]
MGTYGNLQSCTSPTQPCKEYVAAGEAQEESVREDIISGSASQEIRVLPRADEIGDDAKGLVAGHKLVFPEADYHYDNFHLSRTLMDLRRYFRNRLKSTITALNELLRSSQSTTDLEFSDTLLLSKKEVNRIRHISTTLDTLISWLEHDIFNKAGPTPEERRELYVFVVDEFKKLECIEPHRISSVRITLENKR